jgi:DnaJ-class molecular chaperone
VRVPFLEAVLGTKQRLQLADGKTLEVQLPPGTDTGQTLRLKGQGLPGWLRYDSLDPTTQAASLDFRTWTQADRQSP